ncbi:MAG: glutamine-hydrolyzing GMP synthase, partial [Candidatus Thorarchaeota archaeon]|nr:glutamine-hydrolyzing GMP synthase [Candidatus Thorarchaeota archaeon]
MTISESVIVVDYGGQYTHLIARRCRELGVFAQIVPQEQLLQFERSPQIKGVILSGGPRTAGEDDIGYPFRENLNALQKHGIPVLGICFGHQLIALASGASLDSGGNPEYGSTEIQIENDQSILKGIDSKQRVWMSHSDQVSSLPSTMTILATSGDGHIAAFEDTENKRYGVQFHPEVYHTPNGTTILDAFLRITCNFKDNWSPENLIEDIIQKIRECVGDGRVLMGTSGGVDSTVAAFLIKEAIGDRLYCVFVDNGLLRKGEPEEVSKAFREMGFSNFIAVDAGDEFIDGLKNVEDPEEKRRVIADTFIRVFERKANELESEYGRFDYLGQGTIYPDRVESAATGKDTAVIKSHHNVRLPEWMRLKLVEPLSDLYKDEVRKVGLKMNIPERMIHRQPFPGPSLAI